MYATSFRIKVTLPIFGVTQYVNGSCCTTGHYKKGEVIVVEKPGDIVPMTCTAEVIESTKTQRAPSSFGWKPV